MRLKKEMSKNSKIAVLGATGLVGNSILRHLLKEGYKNIIATSHKKRLTIQNSHIEFFQIDLTSQNSVINFFETYKPEYVFLAAAKVGGIFANNTYKADFIYENMMISANVIKNAYKYKVKKLVNLGSSCIYPKFAPQPMKEEYLLTGKLEPTNEPYAIAKISAIKLCRYFNEQYNTNFISLMPANLYGPNDNFDLMNSHVLPSLIRKFHIAKCLEEDNWDEIRKDLYKWPIEGIDENSSKEEILKILAKYGINKIKNLKYKIIVKVWGTGKPYREFLFVDDLAEAIIFLVKNFNYSDIGEFINVGTGIDITIKELAELIKNIVGFKGKIEFDTSKPDGTPKKLLDISRIKKLGWQPKTTLEDGIKKTYKWYVNNIKNCENDY